MHRLAPLLLLAALVSDSAAESRGRVVRIESARRVSVYVPAGRFMMGVDEAVAGYARTQCQSTFPARFQNPRTGQNIDFCDDYFDDMIAMAPREVYVDAFWVDRDEVTVHDYRACVAAGACNLDPLVAGDDRYIRDDWPMVNITWDESQDYCRWRGGRLPTEAEWERAARGDNKNATWPWGEFEQPKDFNHGQPRSPAMREIDRTQAQLPVQMFGDPDDSDGAAVLAPPGSYSWGEGPYGTRDQAGNVAEWTADAYVGEHDKRGYDGLGSINPFREGLANEPRVVRGGSWRQPTFIAKSNLRDPFASLYLRNGRFSHVGFRCARSARVPHDTGTPMRPGSGTEPKPASPRK
jgi:formylglycine-generating enzyme required for sulfatase activity